MHRACNRLPFIRRSRLTARRVARFTDVDGNEYLDFIAGIAVGSVGHCHPPLCEGASASSSRARVRQLHDRKYARARFLELVSDLLPEGITHIQLFSGGAEAVEAAFRLAKGYEEIRVRRFLGRLSLARRQA